MSKPKARSVERSDLAEAPGAPVFSVRFLVALLLMAAGIAWIAYYYTVVRVDPAAAGAEPGGPAFMADLGMWNYRIGFGALLLGLAFWGLPSSALGRGRGVVVGMLGCFLIGLVWIVLFYFTGQNGPIPVIKDLDQFNLLVGIGFMAVGFTFATRWE